MAKFSINMDMLYRMSIMELRDFARSIGVYSPTSLNKHDLIASIISIIEGKSEPCTNRSRKGRPARNKASNEDIVSNFIAKSFKVTEDETFADVLKKAKSENSSGNLFGLSYAATSSAEYSNANVITRTVTGFVDIKPSGSGYIRLNNNKFSNYDVYISAMQVLASGIKTGDEVECIAEMRGNDGSFKVKEIKSINNLPEKTRPCGRTFEELTPVYASQDIKFKPDSMLFKMLSVISPVKQGERVLVVCDSNNARNQIIKEVSLQTENLKRLNNEVIALMTGVTPEMYTYYKRNYKSYVIASMADNIPEENIYASKIAFGKATQLVEQGKDVILFIEGLDTLVRSRSVLDPCATTDVLIKPESIYEVKKQVCLGRNTEEGGSLTVICLISKTNKLNEFICNEFSSICNKILSFKEYKGNVVLNISECYNQRKPAGEIISALQQKIHSGVISEQEILKQAETGSKEEFTSFINKILK